MSDYRTPEEREEQAEQRALIRAVLDEAIRDGAFLKVTMVLDEPPDVVELWVDRLWNGLRDSLDGEDRLRAIAMLLEDRIDAETRTLLRSMSEVGDA